MLFDCFIILLRSGLLFCSLLTDHVLLLEFQGLLFVPLGLEFFTGDGFSVGSWNVHVIGRRMHVAECATK